MTSAYRRDHVLDAAKDEFMALATSAQTAITSAITTYAALYPLPVATSGELRALQRAYARYLIDSGKASTAGVLI